MAMRHDEALREWGARRLEKAYPGEVIERDTVEVVFEFEEGYAYSEYTAEDARAEMRITGRSRRGVVTSQWIPAEQFNFAAVLAEVVEAGGGTVTT